MKPHPTVFAFSWLLVMCLGFSAKVAAVAEPIRNGIRDADGRHVVPRGFVVITSDAGEELTFSPEDYHRMVRLGANAQVIRLEPARLGRFEGAAADETYLARLDTIVERARHAGMMTVFKMTSYGLPAFSWPAFWRNENGEQDFYLDAWKPIWERYRDNPSVFGYDLVNEPRKLDFPGSYDELTQHHLVPLYQRLIDAHNQISPEKICLLQAIFQDKGHVTKGSQYTEFKHPIDRENVVFAPHFYARENDRITQEVRRSIAEGELLNAPVFPGEWGFPTFMEESDKHLEGPNGQLAYRAFYAHMAQEMDREGMGSIKAWFLGSRRVQNFLPPGPSTWAIFTDERSIGTAERKYITDVIARPAPQAIAGDIESFFFDDATRILDLSLISNNASGASRIFVGANRHYPDGFTVTVNDALTLVSNPLGAPGLQVLSADPDSNPADFLWDASRQQLVVLKWPADQASIHVRIAPGLHPTPRPTDSN